MDIKKLFSQQRDYLNHFFDELNFEQVEKLLKVFMECEGVIFFSGVGKSGVVAKKMAVTMVSTGVKSVELSPVDALHGDIGIVGEKDVFVLISKSGESEELVNLVPSIRNKGAFIVNIGSNDESRLSRASDLNIYLPLKRELCPHDMVPTTSTEIQLIFGDVLAIALMEARNFTLDDFAKNHPAGRLGKRMLLKVNDLMLKDADIPLGNESGTLASELVELSNKRCGCLLIVDENMSLKGIFTDGDLRRSLQEGGPDIMQQKLGDLMTENPRHIESSTLAWDARQLMEADQKHPITVLPVVDSGKVVGLIKLHDILQSGL